MKCDKCNTGNYYQHTKRCDVCRYECCQSCMPKSEKHCEHCNCCTECKKNIEKCTHCTTNVTKCKNCNCNECEECMAQCDVCNITLCDYCISYCECCGYHYCDECLCSIVEKDCTHDMIWHNKELNDIKIELKKYKTQNKKAYKFLIKALLPKQIHIYVKPFA